MRQALSLEQLCASAFDRDAGRPAVEFEGQWVLWGEIRRIAQKIIVLLDDCGLAFDSPITFVPRNRPSVLATLLALLSQGRTIRMLYPFQSAASLARQLEQQQPGALIASPQEFSAEITGLLAKYGIAGIAIDDVEPYTVSGCELSSIDGCADAGARQIYILTSGTTGRPKQFAVSYSMIEKYMVSARQSPGEQTDAINEPPALLYFPLANITGIHTTIPPLIRGQRMVLLDRFSLPQWHDFVVRYKPVSSGIPPAAMQTLLEADIPARDLASLKYMGSGAAPLDPVLHREFEARYNIPILLSYGATEFGGPVTAMTIDQHAEWGQEKFGSVGKPFQGFELRVIDPQSGEELPAGEEGVLEVISPRIGPQWIRTSDLGLIDADGFVFLRGRCDGAIMRGGFKVLPETIESALLLHPAVAAASVVGVPDMRLSEVPGAAIQIKFGSEQPSIEELGAHLREHVLATHVPSHWRFVDALPKTPSFKIDRPAVKRLFINDKI